MRMTALMIALLLASPALAQKPASGTPASPPAAFDPELPASDLLVRYEAPTLRFRWALAPEASLEPALVRLMRKEALADREKAIAQAKDAAPPGSRQFQSLWMESWQPEAETDLLLALSTKHYEFTGGAHGNMLFKSVIWDRSAEQRLAFGQLFADPKAAMAAVKPAFCKALDEARKEKRGGQLGSNFADCLDPAAYPIVPMGEGQIERFRVLVPPYEAGPWAEGAYEITLPVSLIRAFLLPRYIGAFTKS
ncbi:polysaccharide deacetylase family protein [Sandaracinobacteroides hominis]|uniref:DUF3298 and DUF4163 domain-containing protein n=1 Tax=Sandaracinobacteroides hominis TaxID=2780086 RepID=UPI0018F6A269|nr:DUF3298 and DUF4163 domain-containing protein [Sandaracinobacteroides hominis]